MAVLISLAGRECNPSQFSCKSCYSESLELHAFFGLSGVGLTLIIQLHFEFVTCRALQGVTFEFTGNFIYSMCLGELETLRF